MTSVQVKLFADLREFAGGAPFVTMEINAGDTIATVLGRLEIPLDRVKIVFLNARAVPFEKSLDGGESLSVFSAIGGG